MGIAYYGGVLRICATVNIIDDAAIVSKDQAFEYRNRILFWRCHQLAFPTVMTESLAERHNAGNENGDESSRELCHFFWVDVGQ